MNQLQVVQQPVSKLVFMKENEVITDSLTMAEVLGKRHSDVLRDIRKHVEKLNEAGEIEFNQRNIAPVGYYDAKNEWRSKYDLTEDGFVIVMMSYTTIEAMKMKVKFIEEFKRMQEYIRSKPKAMNAKESILANMKMTIELNEDVVDLKRDVEQIKKDINERITLDYGQQQVIRNAVNKRVHKLWEENKIDKELYVTTRKVYSALWKNLKDAYQVNAYPNILQKDFGEALSFIEGWRPLFNGSKTA
ncbi:Rha family transcriptional regulator [Bacillus thuringiensis]|uniref:Rha family transcriptional regulator n=1 Tax=Bacillus thuringiensis TaxID=1428 RepID=UPI000A3790D8|nr:Rha family transcriptional regulator [Bacillus thuringiensis]OUA60388.1 Rha family transcriptional regulator [Bacillus thuringiensis serovar bolivia]OUA80039.1 Rha family transcriptional regulator [Bacillus thuringiensis serovar pahangi]